MMILSKNFRFCGKLRNVLNISRAVGDARPYNKTLRKSLFSVGDGDLDVPNIRTYGTNYAE